MTAFNEVVDPADPLGRTSCGYTITYTTQWVDFYGTTLTIADTNFVTWNAGDFRYEVRSDDIRHITDDRQIYKLQLIGSVSLTDMNPIFSKTHEITLTVNNGCEGDEITNIGEPGTGNVIPDYIYYINEATEQPLLVQDSEGSIPFTKTWTTSWQ